MSNIQLANFAPAPAIGSGDFFYMSQGGIEKKATFSQIAAAVQAIYPNNQGSYTTTTADFVQPAVDSNVSVQFVNTAWMAVGQIIFMPVGGFYTLVSITDINNAVLKNLGYPGGAAPSAIISQPSTVVAGGLRGATGSTGQSGYSATTSSFTQPNVGASVTVPLLSTAWMVAGMSVYIGTAGLYTVTTVNSGTSVTLNNTGATGNAIPGTVVTTTQIVTASGPVGSAGATGASSYTNTTATFTQPSSGSTVAVAVQNTGWMAPGQIVYISGGGYYAVSAIVSGVSVTLQNLGYTGNASPGSSVVTAPVSPAGPKGADGSGSGTVTSVGLALPSDFTVTGSPVTGAGTLTASFANTPTGTGGFVRSQNPLITGLKSSYQDLGTGSAIDVTTGNYFSKTITGNTTFSVSNVPVSGQVCEFYLSLVNGGSATVTWWSGIKWKNGVAPTLSASGRDTFVFVSWDGGVTWDGYAPGTAMS